MLNQITYTCKERFQGSHCSAAQVDKIRMRKNSVSPYERVITHSTVECSEYIVMKWKKKSKCIRNWRSQNRIKILVVFKNKVNWYSYVIWNSHADDILHLVLRVILLGKPVRKTIVNFLQPNSYLNMTIYHVDKYYSNHDLSLP